MILGDICTRSCSFCAVKNGIPKPPTEEEPFEIAETVAALGLKYAVITSVTRDDLSDGGASFFAQTIQAIKERTSGVEVEVLIPDFKGSEEALEKVIQSGPDIINHNLETVENLYPKINRPRENYETSLGVLEKSKKNRIATKSGIMVGLGENTQEIMQVFSDLRRVSCDLLTIGQYLQPSFSNIPLKKYYSPQEFNQLRRVALDFGFQDVEAGPMVRSSFGAHKLYKSLQKGIN